VGEKRADVQANAKDGAKEAIGRKRGAASGGGVLLGGVVYEGGEKNLANKQGSVFDQTKTAPPSKQELHVSKTIERAQGRTLKADEGSRAGIAKTTTTGGDRDADPAAEMRA